MYIYIPLRQEKTKRKNTFSSRFQYAKILSLEDFSSHGYGYAFGLDARTRVAMGLDANPRMGLKRTLSSASASGFPSKQQDDGDNKEAISTLSSTASNSSGNEKEAISTLSSDASNSAENSEKKERIVVKINLAAWRQRKAEKEEEEKRKSLEMKLEASKRKLQLVYQ